MKKMGKLTDLVPFILLGAFIVIFGAATGGTIFGSKNMMNILNQSFSTIVAGLGMIFVVSMGGTDITHGALLALSAMLACMAAGALGSWALFPMAILIGACSGAFIGVVNTKFKVPSFMISLAMLIALRALVTLILKAQSVSFPREAKDFVDGNGFKVAVLACLVAAVIYVFHYTRYGMFVRAIGENENAVAFSGVNVDRVKIVAFVISGVMASVAGIFTAARLGGLNNTVGSGFEMRVMMALFIGGIPVQGGMGTKVYKLIIGALMITLLENGLVLLGVSGAVTQGIRGIVLLGAVLLTRIMNDRLAKVDAQNAALPQAVR